MRTFGLENVKAFKDTGDIELAPITIIVGQNSCGKSSFIRFPAVLSQSTQNKTTPISLHPRNPEAIDYGNFEDVIHNGEGDTFSYSISYKYTDLVVCLSTIGDDYPSSSMNPMNDDTLKSSLVHAKISFAKDKSKIIICSYDVSFDGSPVFSISRMKKDGEEYLFHLYKDLQKEHLKEVNYEFPFLLYRGIQYGVNDCKWTLSFIVENVLQISSDKATQIIDDLFDFDSPFRSTTIDYKSIIHKYPFCTEEKINRIFSMFHSVEFCYAIKDALDKNIETEMKNLLYIGPFRNNPERVYRQEEGFISTVGKTGSHTSGILINASLSYNRNPTIDQVSKWLEDTFSYSLEVEEIGKGYFQISLVDYDNTECDTNQDAKAKRKRNIMDVGYGIAQVLPIVVKDFLDCPPTAPSFCH